MTFSLMDNKARLLFGWCPFLYVKEFMISNIKGVINTKAIIREKTRTGLIKGDLIKGSPHRPQINNPSLLFLGN